MTPGRRSVAHNRAERDLASQAAWSAPGVDDVVDNIVVTH